MRIMLLSTLVLAAACIREEPPRAAAPAPAPAPVAVAAAQPAQAAAHGQPGHNCGGAAEHAAAPAPAPAPAPKHAGCGEDHGGAGAVDQAVETKDATGAAVTLAGAKLANAQAVKLSDLVARPAEFAGKLVRIEGSVSTMCTHKRGWFAVQEEGRGGAWARVITTPNFLVPENAVGRKARAEGTVEIKEISADTARYFATGHGLGDAAAIKGDAPIQSVIIRATGAEFR